MQLVLLLLQDEEYEEDEDLARKQYAHFLEQLRSEVPPESGFTTLAFT